eukprot:12449696-Ditylum_brightwellii.AAC.1
MQLKKVEITSKSDNTEIEVSKISKTKVHEEPPKTPKEQAQPNVKLKQEPIEASGEPEKTSEQPREQPSGQSKEQPPKKLRELNMELHRQPREL